MTLGQDAPTDAPYGWHRDQHGEIVPDPLEQMVITRIRQWRTQGINCARIARSLNREGALARGRRWTTRAVRRVLETQ